MEKKFGQDTEKQLIKYRLTPGLRYF